MRSYEMTEIVHRGLNECLTEAFVIAMDDCDGVFLSVDIDVCDPGHAPGTGTPEPGGLSARELLDAVRRICLELPVVGVDVVEVARRTTTPTSPRPWATASSWRHCPRSRAGARTSATARPGTRPSPCCRRVIRTRLVMHEVDQTTEQMVRSVLAYAENRLRMDPVPLDKGTLPARELNERLAASSATAGAAPTRCSASTHR